LAFALLRQATAYRVYLIAADQMGGRLTLILISNGSWL